MGGRKRSEQSYEPLVTPAGWKGDERRFSVRLTQLLDGLFARLGTLKAAVAGKLGRTERAADSEKLGGKLPTAYAQSVSGVWPDSAGNVPYAVAKYYNSYTEGGAGDADAITDAFALVPIGPGANAGLYAALGSAGSYAYVHTYFYAGQEAARNRYQVAVSYNRVQMQMAYRNHVNSTWSDWTRGAAADSETLGGKAPAYYDRPFNWLDNSDLTNPVNQRGYASGTELAAYHYFFDRWMSHSGGLTAAFNRDGMAIPPGNGMMQYLDPVQIARLTGETVTLAAWMGDGTALACSGTFTQGSAWTRMCYADSDGFTITLVDTGSGGAYAMAQTSADAANANIIRHMALYRGAYTADALPPYAPKGYAAELAQCRRYYVPGTPTQWGVMHVVNSRYAMIPIPGAPEMRIRPSVAAGETSLMVYAEAWKELDASVFTASHAPNGMWLQCSPGNLPETLEANHTYLVRGTPALSADL